MNKKYFYVCLLVLPFCLHAAGMDELYYQSEPDEADNDYIVLPTEQEEDKPTKSIAQLKLEVQQVRAQQKEKEALEKQREEAHLKLQDQMSSMQSLLIQMNTRTKESIEQEKAELTRALTQERDAVEEKYIQEITHLSRELEEERALLQDTRARLLVNGKNMVQMQKRYHYEKRKAQQNSKKIKAESTCKAAADHEHFKTLLLALYEAHSKNKHTINFLALIQQAEKQMKANAKKSK